MIGQTLLDRYKIETLLGSGATADVFKAFDLTLERNVAVKLLLRRLYDTDLSNERFLREARLTSKLSHPNILAIFDYGVLDEKQPFLVTEFLDGPTLQDRLDDVTSLAPKKAMRLFMQIAEGISYAHHSGIVHRDLKPSNVLLISLPDGGGEFAKLIDFGFVRVISPGKDAQQITQDGTVLGTAFYISPEQCIGKPADERSDIYSLGCMMYECLAGVGPICGENLLETMHMHVQTLPKPLGKACSGVPLPLGLESLIMSCLEKNPEDRPKNMREVLNRLSDCSSPASIAQSVITVASDKDQNETGRAAFGKKADEAYSSAATVEEPSTAKKPSPMQLMGLLAACMAVALLVGMMVLLPMAGNKPAKTDPAVVQTDAGTGKTAAENSTNTDTTGGAATTTSTTTSTATNEPDTNLTEGNGSSAAATGTALAAGTKTNTDTSTSQTPKPKVSDSTDDKIKDEKDSPKTGKEVDRLANLAQQCHSRGDCDEAVQLLQRSIKLSKQVFGEQNKRTKERMKDLAVLYMTLGEQDKADKLMAEIGEKEPK